MGRIAYQAEAALQYEEILSKKGLDRHKQSVTNAISFATCSIAQNLGAAAIIVSTESGHTAKMVSKYRPRRTDRGCYPPHLGSEEIGAELGGKSH
ncbi:MAG: pyruvate kinase alpha/beta domain-containing protein [Candidatus Syntrophopropionicum ammoniitolerans]